MITFLADFQRWKGALIREKGVFSSEVINTGDFLETEKKEPVPNTLESYGRGPLVSGALKKLFIGSRDAP